MLLASSWLRNPVHHTDLCSEALHLDESEDQPLYNKRMKCTHFETLTGTYRESTEETCRFCDVAVPYTWQCLVCGFIGCGQRQDGHYLRHSRESKHYVFVNVGLRTVYCVYCKTEVVTPAKYFEKLCGLTNLGSTCYLNTVVQSLVGTPSLARYFRKVLEMSYTGRRSETDKELLRSFRDLVRVLNKKDGREVEPERFVRSVYENFPCFKGSGQHDSQEFLGYFIDKLHLLLKHEYLPSRYRSIISDTFTSEVKVITTCLSCSNTFEKTEEYFEFPLPIPSAVEQERLSEYSYAASSVKWLKPRDSIWETLRKGVFKEDSITLDSCLLNFCLPEELGHDDKFFCPVCEENCKISRESKITAPPNVLVLLMKRFSCSGREDKISTYVQFPEEFDLACFTENRMKCRYSLYGLIQHYGQASTGHYVCCLKNRRTGNWSELDDAKVTEISRETVLNKEAYILFYERIKEESIVKLKFEIPFAYAPTYWVNKYYTLAEPGPIYQRYLLCRHKNIGSLYNLSEFTQVSTAQLLLINSSYSCDSDIVAKIDRCSKCRETFKQAKIRVTQEFSVFKRLNSLENSDGVWYLLTNSWVEEWKSFLKHSSDNVPYPGTINNSKLFKGGQLKEQLELSSDYRAVNRHVWDALMLLYGGGPEIIRRTPDIYSPETIYLGPERVLDEVTLCALLNIKTLGDSMYN